MGKEYNFLYKTTNLINGKIYIGIRSTNKIEDGYIGCGVTSQSYANASKKYGLKSAFIDAVIKYGYENFKREILLFTENKEDSLELEELIVDRNFINSNDNYNIAIGGSGGSRYTTSINFDNFIFEEYMKGFTKKQIFEKYNVGPTLLWRIIKDRDRTERRITNSFDIGVRNNVIKWVEENGEDIIDKYINNEITWVQSNKVVPFDLKTFNLYDGLVKNQKYICTTMEGENIFFNTQSEISFILNEKLFISGILNVVKGKSDFYKKYKFKRATRVDFDKIDFQNILNSFKESLNDSLGNIKYNQNRGIIKKHIYAE